MVVSRVLFKALVYTGLLSAQVLSALYSVVTKEMLSGSTPVDPLIFSFLRDALAYPLLQIAALAWPGRAPRVPKVSDLLRLAALGLTGMFLNQYCFLLALKYSSPTIASAIQQVPLVLFLLSAAVGIEAWSWLKFAGVATAVGGCLIMEGVVHIGGAGGNGSTDLALGAAFAAGAAVAASLYIILQRPLLRRFSPLSVTAWAYGFGALFMGVASIPLAPGVGGHSARDWTLSPTAWYAMALAVLGNSCAKYWLISVCNKHAPVTVQAASYALAPILTGALDWALFGHAPELQYLGALAVLAGVALVVLVPSIPRDPKTLAHWQRLINGDNDPAEETRGEECGPSQGSGEAGHGCGDDVHALGEQTDTKPLLQTEESRAALRNPGVQ